MEWLSSKSLQTINAGEDVQKREPLYTASGNVNWFSHYGKQYVLCLAAQSCLILCDHMDCSPPGSSVHEDSPGKNTGMGCHALLQGIFPTQGPNSGLPTAGRLFTEWASREAPKYWVGSLSLLQWIFLMQESNYGLLHCRWILYQMSYQGSPWKTVWRFLKKLKVELPCIGNPIPQDISRKKKKNSHSKRYMHLNVYSSTVYNSQDMEVTLVPIIYMCVMQD